MTYKLFVQDNLGLNHFCITSNGSKYNNPRYIAKHSKNLKKKQQSLARKKKGAECTAACNLPSNGRLVGGSNRRERARKLVAKVHSKITRCREDFLHKLSRKLVNENQVLAVENLNVKGMVRNPNLAKAISDVGWGSFCTMLKYKAEREGKSYIEVDRFFPSSKTCNVCLNQVGSLPLDVRNWTCEHCQANHDRDVNAAVNIKNEALRILRLRSVQVLSLGTSDTAVGGDVNRMGGKLDYLLDVIPCEIGSPT